MRYVFHLVCVFFVPVFGFAQIVNGNAFIRGNFVEVGINQCGGVGSTVNAPPGYHPRSGISPETISDNQLNLGFVADPARDGWSVGTPNYNGDYFMPFAPLIGWSIVFNGNRYGTERTESSSTLCRFPIGSPTIPPFTGSNTSVTTNASGMQAIWQGTNNGLELRKIVTVPLNEVYFTIRIQLKNTTSSPMTGVYYGDYVNPDSDAYQNDLLTQDPNTANSIVNQNPGDNQALVQATGLVTSTYIGLGSRDCRARVFRGRYFENFAPPLNLSGLNGYPIEGADEWFTESVNSGVSLNGADPATGSGTFYERNGCIGIAFDVGTIAPGDSTSFLYTYILNSADFSRALAETNPGFTDNVNLYNSGAVLTPCTNSSIDLKIINGDYNTWTWSPSTGLNTTNGTHVTATVGSTPITYTATSVGNCGNRTVTVVIQPAPTPVLGPDQSITACAGALTNLTSIFNSTGASTVWTSGGSAVSNPLAVGAGNYQLIATGSTGCTDTAHATISLSTAVDLRIASNPTNTTIIEGERIQLSAIGNNISSCSWQPSLYLSADFGVNIVAIPGSSINYQAIALNAEGCRDTAAINITVLPFELEVSAAFTPNADGYTDRWVIRNIQLAKQHKVMVFNRWGNKILETNNYQNNWDGTHNGIPVPDGAYYYVVEAITANDKRVIKKGSLTILR